MRITLILTGILMSLNIFGQTAIPNPHQNYFNTAYQLNPDIPRGVLEAVSFNQTHFRHIGMFEEPSCVGLPQALTCMGLTRDGQQYFRENLETVARVSNYSESQILNSPENSILAYAEAYSYFQDSLNLDNNVNNHALILTILSEIPMDHNAINNFALNSQLYIIYKFLDNPDYQAAYGFPNHSIDFVQLFGADNYEILSSTKVALTDSTVQDENGLVYQSIDRSTEYGPAIWTPAPSCNYSSRNGTPISAITIHTIQGSYAGAISWSQNCNSNVSYHYVIRSSDGQVTQMVLEATKAWHVGSANPYTIGYEHEGYVSDPSWYTNAMVTSSADLSIDVTQSGYGINPLRTYFGPSSTGTNTLGSCIQIKGHQHYPSQTHTDPGVYWDWEEYYQLINNNPSIQSLSTTTGTFYDSGGAGGNYGDDERELYLIEPSNATSVTLNFSVFDLETNWDYMFIYDGNSLNAPLIGQYTGTTNPGTITSSNGSLLIEFRSDCATTNAGWEASWTSTLIPGAGDTIAPTSLVTSTNNWYATDFAADFDDTDNVGGSGIKGKFYSVSDFDGTDWSANANLGFFKDYFDNSISPDWSQAVGTWSISNGAIVQSDELENNTNIYAYLNQNDADTILYHWSGRFGGTGTNRRAGLHFMSDDGSLPNRGNSYFVWFRADQDKLQIYKVVNDVFTLELDQVYTVPDNQWTDYKIVYNKNTGEIDVWVDNNFAASWTDPSPYTTGEYISLRSGNAFYEVDKLTAYINRSSMESVTVGASGMMRYENQNALTPAGNIQTIATDIANNMSAIEQKMINIDWTNPNDVASINDGPAADIDTMYNNTFIEANWTAASDPNSDIARYWYAIGTTAGGTDIVNWTDNWFYDTLHHNGLNLAYGITYYVSVRPENSSGLLGNITISDGQYLDNPVAAPTADFNLYNTFVCQGDSVQLVNSSTNATSYSWSVPGATLSSSTAPSPWVSFPSSGTYSVTLDVNGPGGTDTDVQSFNITIEPAPIADFTLNDTIVFTPNAFVACTNNSSNANGYYWDFGDGSFSTDINPWHIYSQAGIYQLYMIAINGTCPNDTLFATVYVDQPVGIEKEEQPEFTLYPNPSEDNCIITTNMLDNSGLLRIFDISGQLVHSQNVVGAGKQDHALNLHHLAAGSYKVQLITKQNTTTQSLILK